MPPTSTPTPTRGAGGLPVGVGGQRRVPALRRHRQPRGLLDDGQARAWRWRWCTSSPTPTPPTQAKEKVLELARLLTPLVRPADRPRRPLHRNSGGAAPQLPGGPTSPCIMRRFMMRIAERVAERRAAPWRSVTGEISGPGGQPDHGGHGRHRGMSCTLPVFRPAHRHGQGGDHPHRPEDRHL